MFAYFTKTSIKTSIIIVLKYSQMRELEKELEKERIKERQLFFLLVIIWAGERIVRPQRKKRELKCVQEHESTIHSPI